MSRDEEERLFKTIDNMERELVYHREILLKIMSDCQPDYIKDYIVNVLADINGDFIERMIHGEQI